MAERRKQFKLEPDPVEPATSHLREVGGADHTPNVSLTLRMARQRAGYDLKDVAEVLRIRASHLEAIEAGRFDDLPGPTYVSGFLRSYADFLGLDRDEIVRRYREEIGAASRQKLSFPTPSQEGRVPRFWLVLLALVLVGVAYGGWHYYSSRNAGPALTVAEPPADPETATEAATTAEPSAPTAAPASEPARTTAPPTGAATTPSNSLFEDGGAAAPSANQGAGPTSTPTVEPTAPKLEAPPAPTGGSRSLWDDSSAPAAPPASVATAARDDAATASPPSVAPDAASAAPAEDEAPSETAPAPESAVQVDAAPAEPAKTLAEASGEASAEALPPPTEAEIAALEQGGGAAVAIDAPSPALRVAASGSARVVIAARADSWLQIQGPGNELVMTRILRAGETYAVPDRPGLLMVTGNAGGIEITVDGQAIAPLGPVGVVKRNIALDPDSLRTTFGVASR